ncbi:MAG: PD40 domain-containing protein [Verrucomicrobia bacterium]|nr:PD40 domain-containing protein [Verrucomicrobiota bacterium]
MRTKAMLLSVLLTCGLGTSNTGAQSGPTGKIAFVKKGDLYLLHLDNGLVQRITATSQSTEYTPRLSPDGTRIAFYSVRKNILEGIYVMQAAPEGPANARLRLTTFGDIPAWSPDGARIAFGGQGIWVMNADGSGLVQLTTFGGMPAWSPNGAQIAFVSSLNSADRDLWMMNADGSGAQPILSLPGDDIEPAWTPSGTIALSRYTDRKNDLDIYTFDPVARVLSRLTAGSTGDAWPAWSPDAAWIVFSRFSNASSGIYVMPADGSQMPAFVTDGYHASWGP